MSVKIYCEVCGSTKPVIIELSKDIIFPEQGIWGDILCSDCHFVIATVFGDVEGEYELSKINKPMSNLK